MPFIGPNLQSRVADSFPMGRDLVGLCSGRAVGRVDRAACLPLPVAVVDSILAAFDLALAAFAVVQLLRVHFHNRDLGWNRQKIIHLLIGLCNIGYLAYFVSHIVAACEALACWSTGCGFIIMAFPQILFFASFILLLSFWADLFHETNDEDDDEGHSYYETLLDKAKREPGAHLHRRCCSFAAIHVGSRQKFVILVIVLILVLMFAFSVLIWVGREENSIDPSLLTAVYFNAFSVSFLFIGILFSFYGFQLYSKMSGVRSETVAAEKCKVISLAVVCLVCFILSSLLALITNIQVLSYMSIYENTISHSIVVLLYHLIGYVVPSGCVLWVMREMPPRPSVDKPVYSRVVNVYRDVQAPPVQHLQWRTAVTSSQSKALKASPI